MDCTNFIINDHKPFDLDNKLVDVRETLSHCSLSHILVTREAQYLGALSETDALCLDPNMTLSDVQYALTPFFVRAQNSWFEILEAFAQHQTNIMPV
ncbi:MAG: acetoin utilization protein acuB, partial [Bacteroidetes bacterium]|nr:acetoin utilization protein acuB [Bacteroidota bacterium]